MVQAILKIGQWCNPSLLLFLFRWNGRKHLRRNPKLHILHIVIDFAANVFS